MVVIYLQPYIWDALHGGEGRASIIIVSQYLVSETVVTLESILDGLSVPFPNVSIQKRRDCVMDLSTNIDSVVGMSGKISHMFIPTTNHFARVMDSFPSPLHLLEAQRRSGITEAPRERPIPNAS